MSIAEKLTTIAENEQFINVYIGEVDGRIREWLSESEKIPLTKMPEKIDELGSRMNELGYNFGLADGKEEGKQAEYDRFWDTYQQNGNRTNYTFGFAGLGWNHDTFKPKYPIRPVGSAAYMFRYCALVDLKSHCEQYNIVIDTSKATNVDTLFQQSTIETFGDLDTRGCSAVIGALYYAATLRTIKLILRDDGSQTFQRNFTGASNLENLEIVGKIGSNFDLSPCTKLTKDSIDSALYALLNNPTSVQTLTLSATAVNAVYTPEQWEILVATFAPDWTLVLA